MFRWITRRYETDRQTDRQIKKGKEGVFGHVWECLSV